MPPAVIPIMPMPAKSTPVTPPANPWCYEEAVATVETIMANLESGRLPLAEVITQFEQAVQTLQRCETYLAEKRAQVDVLIETLADD